VPEFEGGGFLFLLMEWWDYYHIFCIWTCKRR